MALSETETCRDRLAKYCMGTGLDLGFGGDPIVPWAITLDRSPDEIGRLKLPNPAPTNIVGDATNLWMFSNNCLDYVYSSHLLEDFDDTRKVMQEWMRVIKPMGHLVLFLPDQKRYIQHCRQHGTEPNHGHKHDDFSVEYVMLHRPLRCSPVHILDPAPNNAYSFDLVLQKLGS